MSAEPVAKPLLAAVKGTRQPRPPIWIMRQAGRYLPEYRDLRATVPTFLDLCYNPALATEATLQPLRRFDLDAAILFSDILVVPDALGQAVRFETGEGPGLEPLTAGRIATLKPEKVVDQLGMVLETVERVEAALEPDKTLIGFCGSPWTVASYMIAGMGTADQAPARLFALREPEAFARLLDVLVEASAAYLVAQLRAGADVVQLFESWAAISMRRRSRTGSSSPTDGSSRRCAARCPERRSSAFRRGAAGMLARYARRTGVIWSGSTTPPVALRTRHCRPGAGCRAISIRCGSSWAVQMEIRARAIVAGFAGRPHVFNLGTASYRNAIEHVSRLIEVVKEANGRWSGSRRCT